MRSTYGHMDKLKVKTGQNVKRGDLLGWVGNTGLATGPHLHYEIEVSGIAVDPLKYIID
jgi:murein DD-endopeptidase MepM/ murein hydrolase activator NlpD